MRVHLIKKRNVSEYIRKHRLSEAAFIDWITKLKKADWNEPKDIINTYNSADLLGAGSKRIVFNIGGNNYRVICGYSFGVTQVRLFIKWIGTHQEYTKLCQSGYQYTVKDF